jgi:opacity protein-like surface antigen
MWGQIFDCLTAKGTEPMRSVKSLIAAGAATLFSTIAFAADLPIAPPPMYAPPPPEDPSGWYLRGDIGFSNQSFRRLSINDPAINAGVNPGSFTETSSVDSGGIFDVGVGYRFNDWFRADVIGQYRGKAGFKAVDLFTTNSAFGTAPVVDTYAGSKSEFLFLANAYVDLGTWWNVTPFIGAGVGASRVTISNFADVSLISPTFGGGPGVAYALTGSQWNFAWAGHAGLAYRVNRALTLELGYSYVDLGNGTTGRSAAYDSPLSPYVFKVEHITSHDLKLGVRWNLDNPPPPPMPTYIRKG